MELADLKALLVDEGFVAVVDPDTDPGRVIAVLPVDDGAAEHLLEIMALPVPETQIENARLVQFFAPLAHDLTLDAMAEIAHLLPRINQLAPLMGFNLDYERKLVYFRHVAMLPRSLDASFEALMLETVWLVHYVIDSFHGLIDTVARRRLLAEIAWGRFEASWTSSAI